MAKRLFRGACAILLLMTLEPRPASSAVPAGTWMFANRIALQIFDCSTFLCGKIVWLLRPDDPAGQPDLDHRNPDPALRQRHLCGLTIVWGLRPAGQNHWSNGRLYDPKDGITYHVSDGRPVSYLGLFNLPELPKDKALGDAANFLHHLGPVGFIHAGRPTRRCNPVARSYTTRRTAQSHDSAAGSKRKL
jgi:Uncharacterized protein conserved in bacteria (DUF2147)